MQQFEISFDNKARAAYLRFSREKVAKTDERADGALVLDFDREGNLVGIEVLSPGILNIFLRAKRGQPEFPELPTLNDTEIQRIERLFEVA